MRKNWVVIELQKKNPELNKTTPRMSMQLGINKKWDNEEGNRRTPPVMQEEEKPGTSWMMGHIIGTDEAWL